ncbi:MAG: dihydrofolate reductase family protein [bacterium]|nr:dihydrofolate reductase family protein [bacterium]
MNVFLIAAQTADGFIARSSSHLATDWTSKEDKQFFAERTKKARVVVMGSTTYETFMRPLKDRLNIVYSRGKTYEGVETTQKPPTELIRELQDRGYEEVAICGGATIYTLFMEANCIQTLYLTREPILFGQGITLFTKPIDQKLSLVSSQKLNEEGTVLFEYNVQT